MGRPKDEHYWNHVDRKEDGGWKCKHCGQESRSKSSTRIKAHIEGFIGQGISICPNPPNRIISSNHSEQHMNVLTTSQAGVRDEEMVDKVNDERSCYVEAGARDEEMVDNVNDERVIGSTSLGVVEGYMEMADATVNHENSTPLTALSEDCEDCNAVLSTLRSKLDGFISDLKSEKEDIERQLKWLESHGKKCKRQVYDWLDYSPNMKQRLLNMKNSLNQFGCSKLCEQRRIEEESEKHKEIRHLTEEMKEYMKEKRVVLSNEFVGKNFERNVKKMWKLLRDDQIFIIGIHGMGGVGKTFLANYMYSEIKRSKIFEDVLWVTVCHDFTTFKLQEHIAEIIKVKLYGNDERSRAIILASELEKRENIVLILDDIWKYIDLEKVGIPLRLNGIKLIITSRLRHVCQQMECHSLSMIEVEPFDDYEATELFMLKLGHRGTPLTVSFGGQEIADDIASYCHGLPLGITVTARTMKEGKTNLYWWRHMLNKFETGVEMPKEVFILLRQL